MEATTTEATTKYSANHLTQAEVASKEQGLDQLDDDSGYELLLNPVRRGAIETGLSSMATDTKVVVQAIEPVASIDQNNRRASLMKFINDNDENAYIQIERLIREGVSVETDEKYSPISNAATGLNDKIFNLILAQKPKPQISHLDQALVIVCRDNFGAQQIERCRQLLEGGWNFDKYTQGSNSTPLEELSKQGIDFSFVLENFYEKIQAKEVVIKDANLFILLLKSGKKGMIKYIMNHNDFKPRNLDDFDGAYVKCAVVLDHFEIACELLKKYPDNETMAFNSWTKILDAISLSKNLNQQEYKNLISALLDRKVDMNAKYAIGDMKESFAPIHHAIFNLNIPYIRVLLDCPVNTAILTDDELNLLQFTTILLGKPEYQYLNKSPHNFELLIKILTILKASLGESKFDESSVDPYTARFYISSHQKSEYILQALDMKSCAEFRAEGSVIKIV